MGRAQTADLLTGSRLLIAFVLAFVLASRQVDWAAVLLTVAWITDFFDGRLARSTEEQTKLGAWDFRFDATIGLGLLLGMSLGGYLSMWVTVPVAVLLGGTTILTANPAPAMAMIAVAYARFLWIVLLEANLWWVPFAAIPVFAVADWRRFTRIVLPVFFGGIAQLLKGEKTAGEPILDDWASNGN